MSDLWERFDLGTATIVFIVYVIIDMLYAQYTLAVTNRQPVRASFSGSVIYAINAYGVVSYTQNSLYIVPLVLGAFVGTYVVVEYDRRRKATSST